jgi:hypothetical protein
MKKIIKEIKLHDKFKDVEIPNQLNSIKSKLEFKDVPSPKKRLYTLITSGSLLVTIATVCTIILTITNQPSPVSTSSTIITKAALDVDNIYTALNSAIAHSKRFSKRDHEVNRAIGEILFVDVQEYYLDTEEIHYQPLAEIVKEPPYRVLSAIMYFLESGESFVEGGHYAEDSIGRENILFISGVDGLFHGIASTAYYHYEDGIIVKKGFTYASNITIKDGYLLTDNEIELFYISVNENLETVTEFVVDSIQYPITDYYKSPLQFVFDGSVMTEIVVDLKRQ